MTWRFFAPDQAVQLGYGTSLPATPYDGQEYTLVDSTSAPTYQWRLRYNAGAAGANKWEYVGGAPAYATVEASESTTSLSHVDLTTPGPLLTVPRAGDYLVEYSGFIAKLSAAGWTTTLSTVYVNAGQSSPLVQAIGTVYNAAASPYPWATVQARAKLALAASDVLKVRYSISVVDTAGHGANFAWRRLTVTPLRLS